jgi:hypothetical protein
MMLDALVNEGFLCVGSDGRYARLTTELAHPAHAEIRTRFRSETQQEVHGNTSR